MFKKSAEEAAAVGAIMTSVLYITISLILVGLVGRALSRSGRAFWNETFDGQGGVAEAANRLLVVAFYLLSVGFIALTLPSWSNVASTGRALQLLSGRLGVLLLVLGALHVTSTVVFARLRRARSRPVPYLGDPAADAASLAGRRSPGTAAGGARPAGASPGPYAANPDRTGQDTAGAGAGQVRAEDDGSTLVPAAAGAARSRPAAAPAYWRPRPPRAVH
jgi:hypothetical protein